jgi:Tol biopolymer transport system component
MRAQPFTELNELAGVGAWRDFQGLSPDGTKALFGDYAKGQNFGFYEFATRRFKLLTDLDWSTHWVCCGAWSPRNDAIAYQKAAWSPDAPVEIHVTSLDGTSRMIFRHEGHPGREATVAGWFPDGSKVLVRLQRTDDSGAIGTVPGGGGAFTEIRAVKTRWADSWFDRPALSPDGRFIAFAEPENGDSRDIRVVTIDGSREYRVTEHPADDSTPLWAPDGRHLAFISTRMGAAALWTVAMNEGEPAGAPFKIKDGMPDAWLLNWNDRGIVYNRDTRTWDIFTAQREDTRAGAWAAPRQLGYERTGRNIAATWSPDGQQIALIAAVPGELSRRDVVVLPAQGGAAREYRVPSTRISLFTFDLRWFGNGQGLGFSGRDTNGSPAVFRLTLATGEWQVLPVNIKTWTRIEWNHDGSAFYFARNGLEQSPAGIYERDIRTGEERAIYVPDDAIIRTLKFSASRKWLAFSQRFGDPNIGGAVGAVMVLNPATGEHRALTTVPEPDSTRLTLAWAPGDGAVGVLVTAAGRSELRLASLDGGAVRVLHDVPLPSVSGLPSLSFIAGFDWTSDGRRLAFVVNETPDSFAFIIENPLADVPAPARAARR